MNHLCIYAKPPIAGQTKSRLAKSIGTEAAAALAKAQLIDICHEVIDAPDTEVFLWHPPGAHPDQYRDFLPPGIGFAQQVGESLGDRMRHSIQTMLATRDKVVIIGSDCITHCKASIAAAYRGLDHAEIVLQPATDGGYVLVGQSSDCPEMFENISWGTSEVLEQTYQKISTHNYRYALLPESFDIDIEADLQQLARFVSEQKRPQTEQWIERYL